MFQSDMVTFFASVPWGLSALATLGGIWSVYQLRKLASFFYIHFLHSGSLNKYKSESTPSWALVTGSSDGIGKGFAEELCSHGFNVVLHGRNLAKLEIARAELLKQWPQRKVRILVLDAITGARNVSYLEETRQQLADINLKVLVNNIGGSGGLKPAWLAFSQRTPRDTGTLLDLNATFPTQLTRMVLPQLIENQPALILNLGSVCSEVPSPYGCVYAGAKAYNKAWSHSLSIEMVAEGHTIEVMNILVGEVSTGSQPQALNFFCPSSRRMATSSLAKVACGKDSVWGYWTHDLQFSMILNLPRVLMDRVILGMVLEEKSKENMVQAKKTT